MHLSEQDLRLHLTSTEKSFRLLALEQILASGCPAAVTPALQQRLTEETDEECLLLVRHAVARLTAAPDTPTRLADTEVDRFAAQFAEADPAARLQWLEQARGVKSAQAAELAPRLLAEESHATVAAMIIRIFADIWPEDRLPDIAACLRRDSVALKLAALQALVKRAPKLLEKHLPRLLLSHEPRARALAVQGLAAIDLDEAVDHLEFMFLQGSPAEKQSALRCVGLFPFDRVCDCLLRFVAVEQDPELVRQAGLFFRINPDPETPYRLWEVIEAASPAKAEILHHVVRETCKALTAAGLLEGDDEAYTRKLQQWIHRRAAARFVQQCLYRLPIAAPEEEAELVAGIQARYAHPAIRETFQEALAWPLPPERREALKRLLSLVEQPTTAAPESLPSAESFLELPPKQQIPMMAAWKADAVAAVTPLLQAVLADAARDARVRAAALRTALRLDISGFADPARAALNADNPALVAAGLEYLGRFAFDEVLPLLGKFLKSPTARIKTAALGILQREDVQTAVSSLFAMLRQGNEDSRLTALQCLVFFDFALIRAPLGTFMEQLGAGEVLSSCLCLFEANPDPENLYALYRLEKKMSVSARSHIAAARTNCESTLIRVGRLEQSKQAEREQMYARRYETEEKRAQAPRPAYSLQRLTTAPEETWFDRFSSTVVLGMYRWRYVLGAAMVIFFITLIVANAVEEGRREKPTPMERIPKTLTGMVDSIDLNTNRWRFVADDGEVYLISFQDVGNRVPPVGTGVKLTLIPRERLPVGDIVADLTSSRAATEK